MSANNFPGTGTVCLRLRMPGQDGPQKHQQGVANSHRANHIDRIDKISSKTSDRLEARVIKLREHDDGLAECRPKPKTNSEVPVEKVKTDHSINQCKSQGSK